MYFFWLLFPLQAALPRLSILILTKKGSDHCAHVCQGVQLLLKKHKVALDFSKVDFDPGAPPDTQTIMHQNPDLIFTISSEPTQWAMENFPGTPILFSMMYNTDSVEYWIRKHGKTKGIFLNADAEKMVSVLKEIIPEIKEVGVLTSINSLNVLQEEWQPAESRYAVRLCIESIHSPTDFPDALNRIAAKCDVLYLGPDPLIMQPSLLKKAVLKGFSNHFFVFGESYGIVKNGAMLSFLYDIEEVIRLTTELLEDYANTGEISGLKNKRCEKFHLYYNKDVFEKLGLSVPQSIRTKGKTA